MLQKRLYAWALTLLPFTTGLAYSQLTYFQLHYGQKLLKWNFYDQLTRYQHMDAGSPVQYVGFDIAGCFTVNRKGTADGHFTYSQMLPMNIHLSDSITGKTGGFNIGFARGKDVFPNNRHVDCMLFGGFNTGRMRLRVSDNIRQKNPFFSPKTGLQLTLLTYRFHIGFRVEYEWDISRPGWRRTGYARGDQMPVDALKQSGLTALFQIGLIGR